MPSGKEEVLLTWKRDVALSWMGEVVFNSRGDVVLGWNGKLVLNWKGKLVLNWKGKLALNLNGVVLNSMEDVVLSWKGKLVLNWKGEVVSSCNGGVVVNLVDKREVPSVENGSKDVVVSFVSSDELWNGDIKGRDMRGPIVPPRPNPECMKLNGPAERSAHRMASVGLAPAMTRVRNQTRT